MSILLFTPPFHMQTEDLISDCLASVMVFFLFNYLMRTFVKTALRERAHDPDGFIFRFLATRPITFSLFGFIGAIYLIPFIAYWVVPDSHATIDKMLPVINFQIVLLMCAAIPAIVLNLLLYKRQTDVETVKSN